MSSRNSSEVWSSPGVQGRPPEEASILPLSHLHSSLPGFPGLLASDRLLEGLTRAMLRLFSSPSLLSPSPTGHPYSLSSSPDSTTSLRMRGIKGVDVDVASVVLVTLRKGRMAFRECRSTLESHTSTSFGRPTPGRTQ